MPYSTLADLIERLPEQALVQLTDDAGVGLVDSAKVAAAIARADQEIDAWCGGRYSVPFASPPAVVRGLSADLAIYYLHGRTQDEIPETRKDSHKNALRLLEKIAEGKISLGLDPAPAAPAASGAAIVSGPGRLFSRNSLDGM